MSHSERHFTHDVQVVAQCQIVVDVDASAETVLNGQDGKINLFFSFEKKYGSPSQMSNHAHLTTLACLKCQLERFFGHDVHVLPKILQSRTFAVRAMLALISDALFFFFAVFRDARAEKEKRTIGVAAISKFKA